MIKKLSTDFTKHFYSQASLIKKLKLKFFFVIVNTLFLLFITIALQYGSLTRSDESAFLGWVSTFKHSILGIDPKPDEANVLFLDVSKDIVTIDDPDLTYSGTDSILGAKVIIKDRKKLAVLFRALNKNPNSYQYVICDLLFDYASPDDSIFGPIIAKTKHLTATNVFENNQLIKPIFKISSGCVNYNLISQSSFSKMPLLYGDTLKSLPIVIYEKNTGIRVHKKDYLTYFDKKLAFNTIIPEMYYRPSDLRRYDQDGKKANFFYLGDVITKRNFFNDYLKGKFIIIGDFSGDKHSTFAGTIPGCIILFNTYLTLVNHAPVFSLAWMLLLFTIYFILSYLMIMHSEKKIKEIHDKIHVLFFKKMILKYISFIGILIIIDLISYLFYATFISVFYIATYLTFLEMAIDNYKEVIQKTNYYIMKLKPSFFLLLCLISNYCFSQTVYSVSAQKGNVYYNNKLLKTGDQLVCLNQITAESRDCKIRLLNPQKGSYLISFSNEKPILNEKIKKNSELYQIVIQKYIDDYTASKVLTSRGEFDWVVFFRNKDNNKLAFFEDQKIPLFGTKYKMDSTSKLIAMIYTEKDSSVVIINRIDGNLLFDKNKFPKEVFSWKLKIILQKAKGEKISCITPNLINSIFITNSELKKIVELFKVNYKENYGNEEAAKKDIYDYIQFNYGSFYKPFISPLIDTYFNAID